MNTELIPSESEIENEAKSMLSKTEYEIILSQCKILSFRQHVNEYFDNKVFFLLNRGHTLRVRKEDGKYLLGLKISNKENGSISKYSTVLSRGQYNLLLSHAIIPNGNVKSTLRSLSAEESIDEKRFFISRGSTFVDRYELAHKYGNSIRIFIDKTLFNESTYQDYEIKVESDTSREHAEEVLIDFMANFKIAIVKSKSKYERMFANK